MGYDELLQAIEERGHFESRRHAEQAATATLAVLAERIAGGEPKDLGSQLPGKLGQALMTEGKGEPFDLDEFVRRVAVREGAGCREDTVKDHARAVLTTVADAVSPGERDDFVHQLPADWRPQLLDGGH